MAESFECDSLFGGSSAEALFRHAPRLVASEDLWNRIATDLPRDIPNATNKPLGLASLAARPRPTRWMEFGFALAASLMLFASPWFARPLPPAKTDGALAMHTMAASFAMDSDERNPIDQEILSWLAALGELGVEDHEYTLAFQSP